MLRLESRHTAFENTQAKLFLQWCNLDDESTGETRTHTFFQGLEFGWRPVGGHDDLAPSVDERIQGVAKFLLDGFSLQKLQVVDHERIDAAQSFLEVDRRLVLERSHKAVHKFFGGEIIDAPSILLACPGDRLQKMGFAETHGRMNIKR